LGEGDIDEAESVISSVAIDILTLAPASGGRLDAASTEADRNF
jgi:hypothetical protein